MLTATEGYPGKGMTYKPEEETLSPAYPAAPSAKEFQSMLDFQPPKRPEQEKAFRLYQGIFSCKIWPIEKQYPGEAYRSGVLDGLLFYGSIIPVLKPRYPQGSFACDSWLAGINQALALHNTWLNSQLSQTFRAVGEAQ